MTTTASSRGSGTGGRGTSGPPTAAPGELAAVVHVPVLHLATSLPAAVGDVPKVLQSISVADQRNQADEFFAFLSAPAPVLARLNKGSKAYVAVVNVPKTSLVKIVYGMGFGSSPIGATTLSINGKLLLLHGDKKSDIGPPQPLAFPSTMVDKKRSIQ